MSSDDNGGPSDNDSDPSSDDAESSDIKISRCGEVVFRRVSYFVLIGIIVVVSITVDLLETVV